MSGGVLMEAYQRLHDTGPEWGVNHLTNHGPMAAEVLVRRGHQDAVTRWVDQYLRRLDELPRATAEITAANWLDALGDRRRVGDWAVYFTHQLAGQPWRELLATWWPRLLPGIAAGATHGVIRTGHVVRALLAGAETQPALDELAHALAFWAAWAQPLPVSATPAGRLDPSAALAAIPRIGDQQGTVAARFAQLGTLSGWPAAVAGLRAAAAPGEVQARLTELVTAATLRYLTHGHGQPVLLVHTATAPNAVLHTLPALPAELWGPSLTQIWATTAAIVAAYAPARGAAPAHPPGLPDGPTAAVDLLDRAVAHGDEHVIKFADTAAEVYTRTGNPRALAAALRAATLIEKTP
jgi:hypothetical protein